jgi:hypothetical protein
MSPAPPSPDEERRRLFRRMEWVFVWGPPLLALFFAIFGALFIAWLVEIPGTSLWGRWAILMLILLGIPIGWQIIQRFRE